ncbi:MBL fold metallo-hydrolase [bacterium]|nr:MBL fold metallo-hydrolase [bacterium]
MKKPSKKVVKKIKKLPIVIIILLVILGLAFYFLVLPNLDNIMNALSPNGDNNNQTVITTTKKDNTTKFINPDGYDENIKYQGDNIAICDDGYIEDVIYEDFQIHFLELGNQYAGDSTYIKAGDIDIIIDAGSRKGSSSAIYEYINQYCTDGIIEYVIATHAHQDHIAGFVGNKTKTNTPFGYESERTGLLYYYRIGTIIDFALTDSTTALIGEYREAVDYAVSNGAVHYTAAQCFNEENGAKKHYSLSENANISFDILYNYYYFNNSSDENNYSVCTMFNFNDFHFMLTGDLELEGEEFMAEYYDGSTLEKTLPKVELFKAGHHGSKTSSNDCLLSKIEPKICCVCCCAGCNEYTNNIDTIFQHKILSIELHNIQIEFM